ncbi:U3 snoRNP-associated protein Rrp5 [Viridothelium virens]|uniref:rRNA biogenesis protein RRP5 n=1 Tax=Viridothelium virens TaxID=1048519 RepID=A0A6A6HM09_VIRVR|nr:U3 snoRNP-associated protein Rrp5 [Viridothelium virens]
MAPTKRRADADKSQRANNGPRPKKARKEDAPSQPKPKKSKPAQNDQKAEDGSGKQPRPSLLSSEEASFPRGGASVLTPLEHKQIKIDAERDVLFENRPPKGQVEDDNTSDRENIGTEAQGEIKQKQRSKKRKRSHLSVTAPEVAPEDNVKIESLSFRKLIPGSVVLGQVAQITPRDIALTLPNNLTGYIPLTSVSDTLNQRIETILARSDEDDLEGANEDDDINLREIFRNGQYLRACVVSNSDEQSVQGLAKSKRRIELTLNPRQTNVEVQASDVTIGSTIQAAVVSIEDRGFIMDLGLKNNSLRGFVPVFELDPSLDPSKVKEGMVWLCLVTGLSSNKKTLQLSANQSRIGNIRKSNFVSDMPKLDNLLPGTAVQMPVTSATATGMCGKIAGLVDATADWVHSGAGTSPDEEAKLAKVGSKIKARIICTFADGENKVLVSLLEHVLSLSQSVAKTGDVVRPPLDILDVSAIVETATVVKVIAKQGLVLGLGNGLYGLAHISRLSDDRVDTLSQTTGLYKLGSSHRARVLGYNSMDAQYILSLEQKIIEQPFLRLEDIRVGQVVQGTVERLIINANGIGGLLVNLADGITALVPELHLADVKLKHPERKFKEGMRLSARVLSIDLDKRSIRLTLKKTLINSGHIWADYTDVSIGSQSSGTLLSLSESGAIVQFFGKVRGFLPISEMSEAYIKNPSDHFHVGQTVHVNVRSVDSENNRMTVSCRDPSTVNAEEDVDDDEAASGTLVDGTVTEITDLHITVQLVGSGRPGILKLGHLNDGTEERDRLALKRIKTGQKLQELLALDKSSKRKLVLLSKKPSLLKAARASRLLSSFQDVQPNQLVEGFVRNITSDGVFVEFAGGLVGLLPKKQLTDEMQKIPEFGFRTDQSIKAWIHRIDHQQERFTLSMKEGEQLKDDPQKVDKNKESAAVGEVMNPVDGHSTSMADFKLGYRTQARITSIKETQLNVQLADKVHGRVDISEIFDKWEDIEDKKKPLARFKRHESIAVKIIGLHNSRTHRFLPISHRQGSNPVFELTAKAASLVSDDADVLTLDKLTVGSSVIAFVNNTTNTHVWTTVSPNVHGRIEALDLSDDVSMLKDLARNFPAGTALMTHVKSIDLPSSRLDLVATRNRNGAGLTISDISEGMILAGQVAKASESALVVRLSTSVVGTVGLTQLADDYSQANLSGYNKNEIIRVCVLGVDSINQKVTLSTRPSKVLSSSLPVTDPHISAVSQLKVNDIVRGFVKHISDKGVFVRLSPNVTAFVRLADLSDAFLKEWKTAFKIDELVRGKVTAIDEALNYVQMSLKASMLDENYVAPLTFDDLQSGQIINGKIRKVEDFGAFIVVDNSRNVSGLCHRSEVAEDRVSDVRTLYEEGDKVKAIVLKVDPEKRRINFGLKASYFQDSNVVEDMPDLTDGEDSGSESGVRLEGASKAGSPGPELDMAEVNKGDESDEEDLEDENAVDVDNEDLEDEDMHAKEATEGLSTSGFNWDGTAADDLAFGQDDTFLGHDDDGKADQHRKRKAPGPGVDRTGDLDSYGPQSADDFERQLLGQPNSSALWIQYMAHYLQLGEASTAREIGERALKTIHQREEEEKANVWIALLNLENTYGDDATLDAVFKRACQYADSQTMHERLASIYIDSGKHQPADDLFQIMTRIKAFSANPALWLNYATFLMTTLHEPARARALLSRAAQSVPEHLHRHLTTRFAALEFTSPAGEPERGRTIFEGLVSTFPKRGDLWDQFVDLEMRHGDVANVRGLFERMTSGGGGEGVKMKARRARFVFKRWLEFEEQKGTAREVEDVKKRAERFVEGLREEQGGE